MLAERAYVLNMAPAQMTAEELLNASIPNKRTELVRGVLVVREPPGGRHGSVTMNLALRIGNHAERTGGGQVFAAETGFTLSRGPDTVRAPDIAFVRRERLPDPIPVGFPDLAPASSSKCCRPVTARARFSAKSPTGSPLGRGSSGSSI